jgi:GT2 family glycosyltransferase
MTDHALYIVIPAHNRCALTRDCLASLQRQTAHGFSVIVVDDGSTDGTAEMIQSEFPSTILLRGDGNLWWTGATNLGVTYALDHGATQIMTLNDDTMASENFVEEMWRWSAEKPTSLLGALALDADTRRLIYGGERMRWLTADSIKVLDTLKPEQRHGLQAVTHFPGRGLLIPSEVFSKIGLYDADHFPHYAADYDFSLRANRAGYPIWCNYDAGLLCHFEASGGVQLTRRRNPKNYYSHLFERKGTGNLKVFVMFAVKNCPKRYLPICLVVGLARRIFGYWGHWLVEFLTGLPAVQTHRPDMP